jgi:hypothetical protein
VQIFKIEFFSNQKKYEIIIEICLTQESTQKGIKYYLKSPSAEIDFGIWMFLCFPSHISQFFLKESNYTYYLVSYFLLIVYNNFGEWSRRSL